MNEEFVLCVDIAEYVARCANEARPVHVLPVLRGAATSRFERAPSGAAARPGTSASAAPLDWAACCERILAALPAAGAPTTDDGTAQSRKAIITVALGPAAVCAAFLAAATGRRLRIVERLHDAVRVASDAAASILVALQSEADDALLFGLLDRIDSALDSDQPWREISHSTLVTARDLASLSWMVAKLVAATRRPPAGSIRLRHYAPEHGHSEVSAIEVSAHGEVVRRDSMPGPALLASYAEPADVMAFRTHGSEACANGGGGTVLCGLQLLGSTFDPAAEGVLACGRGFACPRGPHPIPLERMAADVLMVETCNGFRLADSRTLPEFNFALSFIDGPGVGYVSSAFTSIGGGVASRAFLAAMASGCTLGEATGLVNALVSRSRIERTSYLAIGDVEHRTRQVAARGAPLSLDTLPAVVDLGDAHFVELAITDAALVERARRGPLTLAVSLEGWEHTPYFFHRVERRRDGAGLVLAVFLFRFPHALGRARIDVTDPELWRDRARDAVEAITRWCDFFRVAGVDVAAPGVYSELRAGGDEARVQLAHGCALLTVDGFAAARVERRLLFLEQMSAAAAEVALEQLAPKLEGSFWLNNLQTSEHTFERSEPVACPHCHRTALLRTLRHALNRSSRRILVCPRCGICSDTTEGSAIEDVRLEVPHLATAGEEMEVCVVTRLPRAAHLLVCPRLSTHGEPSPPPSPAHVSSRIAEAGTSRSTFAFRIPERLSPHRHYVKVLLATNDGPAFASRPFFVRARDGAPSADPSIAGEERS